MKIPYRPEVDGLRALAVVPVILFHAGIAPFSGGFIGVDVFFVISGFLITSLLLNDLRENRFSLLAFYERRARRILPALLLVIALSALAAWFLLPYKELQEFGRSAQSTAAFISNVFFWKHTGYFETKAELKPLLHTWSLAVEEQYYIVAPILFWILWRYARKAIAPLLAILLLASLATAEYGTRQWPDAAFFLPHTRAWELALGSLAALAVIRRGGIRGHDGLSGLGLVMIVAAIFAYDEQTPFPGLYALLPTLGAALVLVYAGKTTWVNRLLSLPPFVKIGLISYSAYLWHQPLFAYVRQLSVKTPSLNVMLALSAASLGLAYLSWRFVEQPFRRPGGISRPAILGASVAGLAACIALGAFVANSPAAKSRRALSGAKFTELSQAQRANRGLDDKACQAFTTSPKCVSGPDPVALLWGDSYAMALANALRSSKAPLPFVQMTMSACAPILGIANHAPPRYNEQWGQKCIQNNEQVYEWLSVHPEIRYVILSSPFVILTQDSKRLTLPDGTTRPTGDFSTEQLRQTLHRIKTLGRIPVIISPTPLSGYNTGRCLIIQHTLNRSLDSCDFPLAGQLREPLYDQLRDIARQTDTDIIMLSDLICPDGKCRSHIGEIMIYRDSGHLSHDGSATLGKLHDLSGLVLSKVAARESALHAAK